MNGADYVFHVAAITRAQEWNAFEEANVRGTTDLLDAVLATGTTPQSVLLTSSLAAVGQSGSPIADEKTPLNPVSMYGRSKADMEAEVKPYQDKLPIVTVRPPAVYGPRESDIFTFFQTMSRGVCPIIGNGKDPALSLVYVDDLVDGMIAAAYSKAAIGGTFFLGSAEAYSWNEIRDAAATALGRRVLTIRIPPPIIPLIGAASEFIGKLFGSYPPLNREKADEIRRACTICDSSLAQRTFDYSPSTNVWTGLQHTISWYRENGWLADPGNKKS